MIFIRFRSKQTAEYSQGMKEGADGGLWQATEAGSIGSGRQWDGGGLVGCVPGVDLTA